MKINKEQFDALVAKLDFAQGFMKALADNQGSLHGRLATIEQGQSVLCERLDALLRDDKVKSLAALMQHAQMQEHKNLEAILAKLDALQAKELIGDFKRNGRKPCRKSKSKK